MAGTEAEAVDFEPEEDDLMDEDGAMDADPSPVPQPRLRSTVYASGGSGGGGPKKTKGRGFREADAERNNRLAARDFDSLDSDGGPGPQRCSFTSPLFLFRLLSSVIVVFGNRFLTSSAWFSVLPLIIRNLGIPFHGGGMGALRLVCAS